MAQIDLAMPGLGTNESPLVSQSQTTTEGVPPGLQTPSTLGISRRDTNALPSPPPGYTPGPLAPVRHEYEDSLLYKVGTILSSYGETVPTNLKIRLAQQEADLEQDKHKLAWDNYYQNNEMVRSTLAKHNRDAQQDFLNVFPNIKAQISSIADPVQRKKLADHWAMTAEAMAPGSGALVNFFHENQSAVYSADAMLSDPDTSISQPALEMVKRMGYENAVQSKEWLALSHIQNRDRVNSIAARMPLSARQALADGKMDENEFRQIFKATMLESQLRPVTMAAAQAFLDTPQGQGIMVGLGVETNDLKTAKAKKEKPDDLAGQLKNEDVKKTKRLLDFADANPGVLPEQVVKDARLRMDRHLGLEAKGKEPGDFSKNNPLAAFLMSVSKSEFSDPHEMMANQVPGSAEHTRRQKFLDAALIKQAEARPLAGNEAKLEMLKDLTKEPVFRFKNGRLERVKGELSERDYRSSNDLITMSESQRSKISDLRRDEGTGLALFDDAVKAFKAKDVSGRIGELAAENAVNGFLNKVPGAEALAASKYPDVYNYISRKDAALGRYAKSLGGEAGVLTDQDIARVQRMFPTASDTTKTRAAKRHAFQQIIDLNREAIFSLLATKKGTDEDGLVTITDLDSVRDQYKDRVNGILGSVEDLANRDKAELRTGESGAKSLAEPSAGSSSTHRGESLLEKMKKEQR